MKTKPAVTKPAAAAFTFTLSAADQGTLCHALRVGEVAAATATTTAAAAIKALLPERSTLSEEAASVVAAAVRSAVHTHNVNAKREAAATGGDPALISAWNVNAVLLRLGYRTRAERSDKVDAITRACAALVKACAELPRPTTPEEALRAYMAKTAAARVAAARAALVEAEKAAAALA